MKLLLDTSAALWCLGDSPRLGLKARRLIEHADLVVVSVLSAWEVAIKQMAGKMTIGEEFMQSIRSSGFSTIDVTWDHVAALAVLPLHHRDPFDRLLIAQAWSEGLSIVTADRQFERYGIPIIWA